MAGEDPKQRRIKKSERIYSGNGASKKDSIISEYLFEGKNKSNSRLQIENGYIGKCLHAYNNEIGLFNCDLFKWLRYCPYLVVNYTSCSFILLRRHRRGGEHKNGQGLNGFLIVDMIIRA